MPFQPDEIKLMRSVLDEAIIILPKIERPSATKAKLGSRNLPETLSSTCLQAEHALLGRLTVVIVRPCS